MLFANTGEDARAYTLSSQGPAQLLRVRRVHHRGIESYDSGMDKFLKLAIKILHPIVRAVAHGLNQVLSGGIMYIDA